MQFGDIYLKEVIRGVMYQHDQSSSTDVVNTPWEADKEDGRHMVNNLLLEVLKRRMHGEQSNAYFERVCEYTAKSCLSGN